jgi:hypothetical protein
MVGAGSRPAYSPYLFENPAEYAEEIKRGYRKDYWITQPYSVEVWTEKDTIIGSIEPVTDQLKRYPCECCRLQHLHLLHTSHLTE